MPTILLSYRRDDSPGTTGRLFDRLVARYGRENIFIDIDAIPIGTNVQQHIQTYIERCDLVLAIIGPRWNPPGPNGKRRLGLGGVVRALRGERDVRWNDAST